MSYVYETSHTNLLPDDTNGQFDPAFARFNGINAAGTIDFSAAGYAYTIEVDGTARTPDAATRQLQLMEGSYSVIVSASEVFYQETRRIGLSPAQTVPWPFPPAYTIRMVAGVLDVCRGFIDGTEIGILPQDIAVARGAHLFRFACETRGDREQRREVNREGQLIERPREASR